MKLLFIFALTTLGSKAFTQRESQYVNSPKEAYANIPQTDTVLKKKLKKVILRSNQYFSFSYSDKGRLAVINILSDAELLNRDSIRKVSDALYIDIYKKCGKDIANRVVDIVFMGKKDSKYDVGFSYKGFIYNGLVRYGGNTEEVPCNSIVDSRLNKMDNSRYTRNEITPYGLAMSFVIPVKDVTRLTDKYMENEMLNVFLKYLREEYKLFDAVRIVYVNRYDNNMGFMYTMKMNDLVSNAMRGLYNEEVKNIILMSKSERNITVAYHMR